MSKKKWNQYAPVTSRGLDCCQKMITWMGLLSRSMSRRRALWSRFAINSDTFERGSERTFTPLTAIMISPTATLPLWSASPPGAMEATTTVSGSAEWRLSSIPIVGPVRAGMGLAAGMLWYNGSITCDHINKCENVNKCENASVSIST